MTAKWLATPELLQYKVGPNMTELDTIWGYIRDELIQHYLDRHHFEPPVYPYESIVLTLYWLRLYPPERAIAAELDISETTVRECIQHVMNSLSSHFISDYVDSDNAPTERTRVVGNQYCYGAVDSTFIPINQPENKDNRGTYYHMKSPTKYAIKFQLAVHMNGYIWDVSDAVVGSTADITLLRASDINDTLTLRYKLLADKGYAGDNRLIRPHKKTRNGELSEEEKKYNKDISSHRVIVENAIHVLKGWTILGTTYRGNREDLAQCTMIIRTVAALYNLRFPRVRLRAT
jgi:hypothetical protein